MLHAPYVRALLSNLSLHIYGNSYEPQSHESDLQSSEGFTRGPPLALSRDPRDDFAEYSNRRSGSF